MERLTKVDGIGQNEIIKCFGCDLERTGAELEHCGYCEHWQAVVDRLAAYEDTGLEPEEVRSLRIDMAIIKAMFGDADVKRMKELCEADKEGRVVVLPCKVENAVYWLHGGAITECRVHRIQWNRSGLFLCLKSAVSHGAFRVDSIGKTVFLTRAEAEAALSGGIQT